MLYDIKDIDIRDISNHHGVNVKELDKIIELIPAAGIEGIVLKKAIVDWVTYWKIIEEVQSCNEQLDHKWNENPDISHLF